MKYLDLLSMRFTLLNVSGAVLLWYGLDTGVVQNLFVKDATYLSETIVAVFVLGLTLCAVRVFQCSLILNSFAKGERGKATGNRRRAFTILVESHVSTIARFNSVLLALGIIGTMYGIITAISEANLNSLTNIETVGSEMSVMVGGLMTMFVTTITGLVCGMWIGINLTLLENGYRKCAINMEV